MKNKLYLIKSNDTVYIEESLKEIVKKEKHSIDELIKYDMDLVNVAKAIEDLDTYNFLEEKKVVLIYNPPFMASRQKKDGLAHDEETFIKYIENPSPDNALVVVSKNFSAQRKISKKYQAVANLYQQELNLYKLIKERLGSLSMDNQSINYFIDFCNKDSEKIVNEINKLVAYFDSGDITIDDIDTVCYSSYEDNVFKFLDELTMGNKTKALHLYDSLVQTSDDAQMVLALTNDHFNLLLNVKNLDADEYRASDIQKELGQKSLYRVEKMLSYKNMYSVKNLLKILNDLCDLDIANKTNKESIALFETFIISL